MTARRRIGYRRRSLAETAVSRLKVAFGGRLKNRGPHPSHRTHATCRLLNAFVAIGNRGLGSKAAI